jgi:hypothetical protein
MALLTRIELDNGTGANLSSEIAIGEYTATSAYERIIAGVRLSNLNGAAATFICVLRHKSSGGTLIREEYFAQAKRTAANTVFGFDFAPFTIAAGEKLEVRLLSSNASDTNVTWSVEWFDAMLIDADVMKINRSVIGVEGVRMMGADYASLEYLPANSIRIGGEVVVLSSENRLKVDVDSIKDTSEAATDLAIYASGLQYLPKLNVSGDLAHTDNADFFKADVSGLVTQVGELHAVKTDYKIATDADGKVTTSNPTEAPHDVSFEDTEVVIQ